MLDITVNFVLTAAWLFAHFLIVMAAVYAAVALHHLAARLRDDAPPVFIRSDKTLF